MYYPLFRGKRFDYLAIREALPKLVTNGKIIPIIEPVKASHDDLHAFLKAVNGKIKHAVLINPTVGPLKKLGNSISPVIAPYLVPGNDLIPGFNVGPITTQAQVTAFLAAYPNRQILLLFSALPTWMQFLSQALRALPTPPILVFADNGRIPASHLTTFAGLNLVLLRDCFQRHARNDLYPNTTPFGNLHQTYLQMGYQGFGDYLIVGASYRTGGIAYSVTIHLTEECPIAGGPIIVNHFKSTSPSGRGNTSKKVGEALSALVTYVSAKPASFTYSQACVEFQTYQANNHSPGLSIVKKLSLRHHLELMDTLV